MGWDARAVDQQPPTADFNPPTPCGVGPVSQTQNPLPAYFNPPTPCGVGPQDRLISLVILIFQSTHPLWGGTQTVFRLFPIEVFQSTHPLWGGTSSQAHDPSPYTISIHPPLVGWDRIAPARPCSSPDFNPPTPCGVGLMCQIDEYFADDISIHPPLVGWD